MEAEQASLSTIIIDSNGNPIGQVIYRCALCRKICDSSSDAMIHYQLDHIQQQQQNLAATTNHQALANHQNARSSSHHQRIHHSSGSTGAGRHQQFATSSATSTANSLLKRATSSSLLKRTSHGSLPSTSAAQNSLLKRGPNVMRCYESGTAGAGTKGGNIRRQLNSANKLESIHRQYTTTSASRAAKRHMNPPKGNFNTNSASSNNSACVNPNSIGTNKSNSSGGGVIGEKTGIREKSNQPENDDSNKSINFEQIANTPTTAAAAKVNFNSTNSSRSSSNQNKSLSSKSQAPSQTKPSPVNSKDQLLSKTLTSESESTDTSVSKDTASSPLATSASTTPRRLTLTPKSYYNLRRRFNKNFKNKN